MNVREDSVVKVEAPQWLMRTGDANGTTSAPSNALTLAHLSNKGQDTVFGHLDLPILPISPLCLLQSRH